MVKTSRRLSSNRSGCYCSYLLPRQDNGTPKPKSMGGFNRCYRSPCRSVQTADKGGGSKNPKKYADVISGNRPTAITASFLFQATGPTTTTGPVSATTAGATPTSCPSSGRPRTTGFAAWTEGTKFNSGVLKALPARFRERI